MAYFYVALAGGFGALARYLIGKGMVSFSVIWPWSTLLVNVLGSFLMGYFSWMLVQKWSVSAENQAVILTGFLGGFTTFSAFSLEVLKFIEQGEWWRALGYISASVVLCVVMCAIGLYIARHQ